MARRISSAGRKARAGQLFLFGAIREAGGRGRSPAAPSGLPDLGKLFDRLNRRFFGGRLRARCEWSTRLTASAGTCFPSRRLIRISLPYHERRPEALPATLAHEMCHLLVPAHGRAFRELAEPIAGALGVSWDDFRYSELWADAKRYRYVYACPRCGTEYPSRKRLRASCGRCRPGRYDEKRRLVLTESRARPGPVLRGERPARDGRRWTHSTSFRWKTRPGRRG